MSLFNATRLCLLCSYRSIDLKQFGKTKNGEVNAKTHQTTDSGLICSKCDGFVCQNCISILVPALKHDSKHFQSVELLNHYCTALQRPTSTPSSPPNYVGHCCLIEVQADKHRANATIPKCKIPENNSKPISSTGTSNEVKKDQCSSSSPSTASSAQQIKEPSMSKSTHERPSPSLSGTIFYPEFNIFIDSPFQCVDVHALGEECSDEYNCLKRKVNHDSPKQTRVCNLPGRWHCVVPYDSAKKLEKISPKGNGKIPSYWNISLLHKIKVKLPHSPNEFKKYTVRLIHIPKQNNFNSERKATNLVLTKELKEGYLFANAGPFKDVPDVTLILGSDGIGTHASILLCRFHKLDPNLNKRVRRELFCTVWGSLNAKKLECMRSGGSSGLILDEPTNLIRKFMSDHGASPRSGKGTVWIRGRDTWFLYYIGTLDGELKRFKYTNPVPGGKFQFKSFHLEQYPFLNNFLSVKPITALIIEAIQGYVMNKEGFRVRITPQAVATELSTINKILTSLSCARAGATADVPPALTRVPHEFLDMGKRKAFYALYNHNYVKYTLVCHSVGFHLDYFKGRKPTIENKVCFEILKNQVPAKIIRKSHPHGRSGGSSGKHFVFAILDW